MNAVQVSTLNIQLAKPSDISKEVDGKAHGIELVQLKDQVCSDSHLPDASKLRFVSHCGMFMPMWYKYSCAHCTPLQVTLPSFCTCYQLVYYFHNVYTDMTLYDCAGQISHG